MTQVVSPKAVAKSIGVSESSLKRWCDQGLIRSSKTPGGHRRIQIGDVLHFLRQNGRQLVRADLIGLPAGVGAGTVEPESIPSRLREALSSGSEAESRQIVLDQFVSGVPVAQLCEELLTPAMHDIGRQWETGCLEIFEERFACTIVQRILNELRQLLPEPTKEAPVALGGAPEGDHYTLAMLMVELSLRDAGWNAISLGVDLPIGTLTSAIEKHQPQLFWLSVTREINPSDFRQAISDFSAKMPAEGRIVIGGQAVDQLDLTGIEGIKLCRKLADLKDLEAVG